MSDDEAAATDPIRACKLAVAWSWAASDQIASGIVGDARATRLYHHRRQIKAAKRARALRYGFLQAIMKLLHHPSQGCYPDLALSRAVEPS